MTQFKIGDLVSLKDKSQTAFSPVLWKSLERGWEISGRFKPNQIGVVVSSEQLKIDPDNKMIMIVVEMVIGWIDVRFIVHAALCTR